MNLPDPQQLLPRMAADLKALLARRGVAQAHFIGIHTGGVWVAEALLRELGLDQPLGTLDVSFYRDDFTRSGLHPQVKPSQLPFEIEDQHLVLIRIDEVAADVLPKDGFVAVLGMPERFLVGFPGLGVIE